MLKEYDYAENALLHLVVLDEERDGYLILGYANGHIAKVPIGELMNFSKNKDYSRENRSKLLFATIASNKDAVLSICREDKSKGKVVMRLDSIKKIAECRISESGELPYNEGLMKEVLSFEVIPQAHLDDFSRILDQQKTTLGVPGNTVTSPMINKLHLWGIKEI